MPNLYDGVDEIRDSKGRLFTNLGFGQTQDWEPIARFEANADATVNFVFSDVDLALYDKLEFEGLDVKTSVDGAELRFRVSDDNGATFEATSYQYGNERWGPGAASLVTTSASDTHVQMMRGLGSATNESFQFVLTAFRPDSALTKHFKFVGVSNNSISGDTLHWDGSGMFQGNTNLLNGFQFLPSSGNFASGTFIMRGRRKISQSFGGDSDWVVIDDQANISSVATHDVFWDDQVWDEIEVKAWGIVVDTDAQNVEWVLSTDGSTFNTGASAYRYAIRTTTELATNASLGSTASSNITAGLSMGTGTDEEADLTLELQNVSNTTRKKRMKVHWELVTSSGIFNVGFGGASFVANNNSLRGVRLDGQGSTTFSADRIRVRGRRLTATAIAPNDWELISQVKLTANQATIPFTNIPATEFDEFELTIKDADTDTTSNTIELRFSANNGTSYDSSASYAERGSRHQLAGETLENSNSQTSITLMNQFGSSTVRKGQGTWKFAPLDSVSHKTVYGMGVSANDTGDAIFKMTNGLWSGTGSGGVITAFQLSLNAGGNFEAGSTFTLRGRRKAA